MFTNIKFLVVGSLRILAILPSWMVGITYERDGDTEYDSVEYFWTLAAAEEAANQRAQDLLDEGFRNVKAWAARPRKFTVVEGELGLVHNYCQHSDSLGLADRSSHPHRSRRRYRRPAN